MRVHGYATALKESARAGHSEHQLGTTVDFRAYGGSAPWNYSDWGTTKAGAWLKANAWKYGFVMSYPADSRDRRSASATGCPSGACAFDQDLTHRVGGDCAEVRAILPAVRPVLHQPEVRFMDERCGLEGLARALTADVIGGQPSELLINNRQ